MHMEDNQNTTIVIQAGGKSSRMGQDKALMPFLGRPLIERLVERVKNVADSLLVITNRPEAYAFLGLPLFMDMLPGVGPLGGLYTALSVANTPVVTVVACDMPFLSPALLEAQQELLLTEGADAVIPRTEEGLEPLHATYRRETCLPAVRAALDAGERKMIAWFPEVRVREMAINEVARHDPDLRSFINVNHPDDYRAAEELAKRLETT
jgi:molybdopterin-guanine dinucleotide biosynthesis protein A